MKVRNLKHQKGFTIVELMIALSVLSLILVAASAVMIQVGSLYTKGVNSADLQNTNRNILDDVATSIQFSGSKPMPCADAGCTKTFDGGNLQESVFCINDVRYSYVLNREQGTDPHATDSSDAYTPHVLWRDTIDNGAACTPLDLENATVDSDGNEPGVASGHPSNGYDMVQDHMRLTAFTVTENPAGSGVYDLNVAMAYGDDDLLTNNGTTWACKGDVGTQYCALSDIQETVDLRVN